MASQPSVATSPAAASSSSACSNGAFSQFPTQDTACAVGGTQGVPSNYNDILKNCCKSAPVESYANGCALWCLSVDQTVADLQKCFQDGGVNPAWIFCNGNNTATATGKPTGTGAQMGHTAGSSTGAAPGLNPQGHGVNRAGMGILAMVLVSAVFGAFL